MYHGLVANTIVMWYCGLVQYIDGLTVLVLLRSWSVHASSQTIMTNDLELCSRYLGCTKLNTKARNQLASQPIAIFMGTDWAMKRNMSAADGQYL